MERINGELSTAVADPRMRKRLVVLGGTPLEGTPSDFARLVAVEIEKWGEVVRFSGAKVE